MPETPKQTAKHEQVIDLSELSPKLSGFIAIHNTVRGPALGGTRLAWNISKDEARLDALKLSEAMTYKCAIADLPFGGGKGLIIVDQCAENFSDVLEEYARIVGSLQGKFYTGVDVGLTPDDVAFMLRFAPYFIGKAGQAGDPSYFAAVSCFNSIVAALEYRGLNLKNSSVAVKAVGKTGSALVKMLAKITERIYIADIDPAPAMRMLHEFPFIKIVSPEEIHRVPADVFAPCALGGDINSRTLAELRAQIICGTANNQLADNSLDAAMFERGILYVPDFVANAGGLIDVADELLPGGYSLTRVREHITQIDRILRDLFVQSKRDRQTVLSLAVGIAESRFKNPNYEKTV